MRDCDAIVDLWYPGDMGGHALADVLFGRVSPAGRTTQTWYQSDETMPKQGLMTMRPAGDSPGWTYRYHNKKPAIPFGFGLSYTEFTYSALTLSAAAPADPCAPIGVNVTVTNVGKVDSDEVVQCYIKQPNASTAPQVRLADFARVHIKAGQSSVVSLTIAPKEQALVVGSTGVYQPNLIVPKGIVEVHVGGGQPDFYAGSVMTTVEIVKDGKLTRSYECAENQ